MLLYDVENYRKALEPAIRVLAPYTDFYNFKCEQTGSSGQVFDPQFGSAFQRIQ